MTHFSIMPSCHTVKSHFSNFDLSLILLICVSVVIVSYLLISYHASSLITSPNNKLAIINNVVMQ